MSPAGDRRRRIAALAAGIAVALAILAIARIFWPGVPMYDTVAQYRQVLGSPVDDWHPPVMVRLWQLLHPLVGGTAPMFALQVTLYAAGFGLVVAALVRIGRPSAATLAGVLALSPLLLGWQMVVLKDLQMLAALIAAIGLVAIHRLTDRPIPALALAAIALLIVYATLLRANALFATVPLTVMLLPTRNRLLPSAALAIGGAVAVLALTPILNHGLLRSQPSGITRVEPIFDLAGIAVRTPRSAPSVFTPSERAQIISRHCVKAYFWDPLGDPGECAPATDRLMDQSARQLYLDLANAAARHPIAYAAHRLAHWNSTERWLVAPGLPDSEPPVEAEPNQLGLSVQPRPIADRLQQWADDEMATPLGWPIVWTVLALLLLPQAWRRRCDPAGALALALLASAAALEASFLAISIASDLRYHLWPITASALSLILLCDRLRLKKWEWALSAATLTTVIAGGLIARSSLPRAPDSYQGMIQAASG